MANGVQTGVAGSTRRYWNEATAAGVLREAERSGQTLTEFCRDRELNYERVRRWRIRLNAVTRPKRVTSFVPVEVVDVQVGVRPAVSEGKVTGVVEFDVGGCVIRMRGDVSEMLLVRALRAAKEATRC